VVDLQKASIQDLKIMFMDKQKAKNYFKKYPRTTKMLGFLYHVIDFYRINKRRIEIYEDQLRLHQYFETVYGKELDYLRDRCCDLEIRLENSSPGFERLFPTRSMLPTDLPGPGNCKEDTFQKYYETKNRWVGMTAGQRLYIESWCLKRLNTSCSKAVASAHFPKLYRVSSESNAIEMSHCGTSLDQIYQGSPSIVVDNSAVQIEEIVRLMEEAGVRHLDLRPDGKNLCVSHDGRLTLIDFDVAILEGQMPLSAQVFERYIEACAHPQGYRGWASEHLHAMLELHSDRLILR